MMLICTIGMTADLEDAGHNNTISKNIQYHSVLAPISMPQGLVL
jgi:hypothetical protein